MKKSLMIIPLVILLCFATGYSNAETGNAIITLQDGGLIFASNLRIEYYGSEVVPGTDQYRPTRTVSVIYYCYTKDRVVVEKNISFKDVESIEVILNDKYNIKEFKINLWDGRKVIVNYLDDKQGYRVVEVSYDGEEKAYTSIGLLQGRAAQAGKFWVADYIIADATVDGQLGYFMGKLYEVKTIRFER